MALAAVLTLVAAIPVPAWAGGEEVWDAERAFMEMERLQAEIGVLRALAGAQEALLAWNRERADSGAAPGVLRQTLCAEEALRLWCRALPATFGADAATAADGGQREDVER